MRHGRPIGRCPGHHHDRRDDGRGPAGRQLPAPDRGPAPACDRGPAGRAGRSAAGIREISVTEAIEIVKRKTGIGPADDAEPFLADRTAIRGFILRGIEYSFALQIVIQAAEREAARQAAEEAKP